jgi:excisionase family DNA binding protein
VLTYAEAARELHCSISTLRRRIDGGALPAYVDGKLRGIREDDLHRYIAERVSRRSRSAAATIAPSRTLPKGARLWD